MTMILMMKKVTRNPVPQRTCVACRRTGPKSDFIRLVKSHQGRIMVDEISRERGRGAYLCRNRTCWESALGTGRKDKLARALKTTISKENRTTLMEYATRLHF